MRFIILFCFLLSSSLHAQDPRLAQQYYEDGEYEKASVLYKSLMDNNPGSDAFFSRYLDCLTALKQLDQAEDVVKKEIKKRPKEAQLHVLYGNLLFNRNEPKEAEDHYQEAINRMGSDVGAIHRLANAFININRYDLAIQCYEKGEKISKPPSKFTYNLADLYRRQGDNRKMIEYYLDGLEDKSVQLQAVQSTLIVFLNPDMYRYLQSQLYLRLEKNPESKDFAELLQWAFIQVKDYAGALRQAKALDKKLSENGQRVYGLSLTAYLDNDYRTAIDGFEYIKNLGPSGTFYHESCRQVLICKRQLIVEKKDYRTEDLLTLEQDYKKYKEEFGSNYLSAQLIIEYAELEARYLQKLEEAIHLLDELVSSKVVEAHIKAKAKLDLADYYLITGERWEATLLYSQVDKDFKEDELGEMARFRNARLSYFAGDFQWAQEQFDILKRATSKLISNDAIDLSVFIMDNLNQDTTGESLMKYASAELKLFQNQYDSALFILNQIPFKDPDKKSLEDDVWYLEGKIYDQQRRTDEALEKFKLIVEKHAEEIRADNALYEMARIYDYQKNDKEKAKELYEKLFLDFSNSILAVEARKRYRYLRGDKVQ